MRAEAVGLVTEADRAAALVAAPIDVGAQFLRRRVQQSGPAGAVADRALNVDQQAELERLRIENSDLRLDPSFLKNRGAFRGWSVTGLVDSGSGCELVD